MWFWESLIAVKDKLVAFFKMLGEYINPVEWVKSAGTWISDNASGAYNWAVDGITGANNAMASDINSMGGTGLMLPVAGQDNAQAQENRPFTPDFGGLDNTSLAPFLKAFKVAGLSGTTNNTMTVAPGAVQINLTSTGNGGVDANEVGRAVENHLNSLQRKQTRAGN